MTQKNVSWWQLFLLCLAMAVTGLAQGKIPGAASEHNAAGGSNISYRRKLIRRNPRRAKRKVVARKPSAVPRKSEADAVFEQAEDLVDDKKYPEALVAYQQALKLRPGFAEALYGLGWIHNELEQYDLALPLLTEALRQKTNYADANIELGYAHRKLKKYDAAVNYYREAIRLAPQNAMAWFGLGDSHYYGTRNYAQALEAYLKGLKIEPDKSQVNYNVGWLLNDAGRHQEALDYLEKSLQQQLERPETAQMEMGYAYSKMNRPADAIESYRRAISLRPDYATAYFGLGDVYRDSAQDLEEAAKAYLQGLRYNPANAAAQYWLGWCYNDMKRFGEAVAPLTEAVRLKPEYTDAFIELGYTYYRLKQYQEAQNLFGQILQHDSKNSLAQFYSGLNFLAWGRRSDAMQAYRVLQGLDKERAQKLYDIMNKVR